MSKTTTTKKIAVVSAYLGLLALVLLPVGAYDRYSINDDATNCGFCHGDFRANSYTSLTDGQTWDELHDIHRSDMLSGDCLTCHKGGFFPVPIGESDGGNGLAPIGCVGCHGRAEDGTGNGTEGYGLAMQRRHEAANVGGDQNGFTCFTCHPGAATAIPVGEDVLPPYYANPGVNHPNIPVDPCNPAGSENFAGAPVGIDNDGDFADDQDDSDCMTLVTTAGEASGALLAPLLVSGKTASAISISYGVPCSVNDHRIHFGPLGQASSYLYTGTECNLGSSGSYTWTTPGGIPQMFFLVVGNDAALEGSYGVDSGGTERPVNPVSSSCSLPQDLTNRCDP